MRTMRFAAGVTMALTLATLGAGTTVPAAQEGPLRFQISLPPNVTAPMDGRLLLMIAKDEKAGEPRFQISADAAGQLIFGVDVENWVVGKPVTIDGSALGFPLESLNDIPAGRYSVQALLHKYGTFKRADG